MFLDMMLKLYIQAQLFFRRRDGASAIEYVIIVTVVALVILGAGTGLGDKIKGVFTAVGNGISAPATGS
jgi:pilus assembly protein Flp/PilA